MSYFNWRIVEYLFSLIESVLFFYFLSMTLKRKENVSTFIYIFSVGLYFIIICFLTNIFTFSNSTLIVVVLISLIYAVCMYNGNLKSKVSFTIIFFVALILCDVFIANILGTITGVNIQKIVFAEKWFRGFLFCISKMTLILILKIISHFTGNEDIDIPSKYWYMIMGTFAVSLVILMVIGEIGILTSYDYNRPIYFIISCIGILIINIFIHYIFIQLSRYYEKEQLYNIIKIRNEMMEEYYIEKEKIYNETRKLGHDFKNHIFCILALLYNSKIDEAKRYAEDISETINIHSTLIKSGNDIVDAILNQELAAAGKSNVYMDIDAIVPKEVKIKSMDLCAILANVIDNAMEAAMKIKDEKRREVKVKIKPYKDYLFISVSNEVESNPLEGIRKSKTTKKDNKNHGLGIQIIKNVIERYNGSIEYDYDNNSIIVKILIRFKD